MSIMFGSASCLAQVRERSEGRIHEYPWTVLQPLARSIERGTLQGRVVVTM